MEKPRSVRKSMDGWLRLMYVLSSRVSAEDGDEEADEEEAEGDMDSEGVEEAAGVVGRERFGVAGLGDGRGGTAGAAVGDGCGAAAGVTSCGVIGLLAPHISHVARLPGLWYVHCGHIHSAVEEAGTDDDAVGDGEGGCGDGERVEDERAEAEEEVGIVRGAEGVGRVVSEGAGDAERGRGVLHVSHMVRAGMLMNVHVGQTHSPLASVDMLSTEWRKSITEPS